MEVLRRKWTAYLVAWYGLLQGIHLVLLTRAGVRYLWEGAVAFPAPPPPEGWSPQAVHFLVFLGGFDFFIALLALGFAYGYFRAARGWFGLGLLSLSAACFSALVFAYGTAAAGAWSAHPGTYLTMIPLFLPVAVLFLQFLKALFRENQ
jgi:hypothetical protein